MTYNRINNLTKKDNSETADESLSEDAAFCLLEQELEHWIYNLESVH